MKDIRQQIRDLDRIDPLSEAESITGEEYKGSDKTVSLGMRLHLGKGEKMRALLNQIDDTQFSETVANYIRKVGKFGFEVVLCDKIRQSSDNEHFYILFNSALGVLISFDTHRWDARSEENVNGGHIYYNWLPANIENRYAYTSSGGYEESGQAAPNDLVWIGHHDCREAAITNIMGLQENGTLLKKWIKQPFFWFVAHDESKVKGYDYRAITYERYSRLPEYVKGQIGPYHV